MPQSFLVGNWRVEPELNTITGLHESARIEPKVMQVLICLAEHNGRVVPKERLINRVWSDTSVTDDVLTRSISELRRIFADDPKQPRFIQTIPKGGYRLIAPVSFDDEERDSCEPGKTDHREVRSYSWNRGAWMLGGIAALAIGGSLTFWLTSAPAVPTVVRSIQLTYSGQVATPDTHSEAFPALVTDGPRVYFSEFVDGRWTLAQAPVGGGEVVQIATPFKSSLLVNVSPDGSRLLVRDFLITEKEGPLWVLPASGGAPRRLGDVVGHDGAWSPDGQSVVFARGTALYLAASNGGDPQKLVETPGRAYWLRWAPNGSHVRFTVVDQQANSRSLWEVSVAKRETRPLLPGWSQDNDACCGDWTPNGRYFVFQNFRDGRADIWAIGEREFTGFRSRMGEPTRLTSGPLHFPSVVPAADGKRLLVTGTQPRGEVLRYDLHTRTFEPYSRGVWARDFAFSRNGEQVAYVENLAKQSILWRSAVDGSQRVQLTQPPLLVLMARWSPDGERIAFVGKAPGRPWKIYIVPTRGGELRRITDDERNEFDPAWSPDGRSLMFGRPPDYVAEPSVPKAIHILDLKTQNLSTLPASGGLLAPRWSPDGRYVAAMSLNQTKLMLFDFKTGNWSELARSNRVHNPVWSRDGRWVYFQAEIGVALYRVRTSDHALEKLAGPNDVKTSTASICFFAGLALDDSPLLSCRRADIDLYALEWKAP
jgi:Tol biopolymer transport system component/DNA-binding winged helix-turn-helix (wHTH) protein